MLVGPPTELFAQRFSRWVGQLKIGLMTRNCGTESYQEAIVLYYDGRRDPLTVPLL